MHNNSVIFVSGDFKVLKTTTSLSRFFQKIKNKKALVTIIYFLCVHVMHIGSAKLIFQ